MTRATDKLLLPLPIHFLRQQDKTSLALRRGEQTWCEPNVARKAPLEEKTLTQIHARIVHDTPEQVRHLTCSFVQTTSKTMCVINS